MSAVDSQRHWSTITSVATLGTSRATFSAESLWPDDAVAQSDSSRERSLLRVAAARYLWQTAGARSPTDKALSSSESASANESVPTAEASTAGSQPTTTETAANRAQHPVSEAAAWRLARMINGDHGELIPEWFALAARARAVISPHWLPVILDALDVAQRSAWSEVLGEHATWLAARNPAWSMGAAAAEPSEEHWTSGTAEQRRIALATLRARDPAQARRWVESTWATDPPEAREEFVRCLLIGLTAEDEPFLETALDDRRKSVRLAAAECLARLPDSAHARRSIERLEGLVVLDPARTGLLSKLSKRRLRVQLPASLDKAAIRDGIEANVPANRKIGERTWWLAQMISLVRPAYWTTRFACTPNAFIEAALATEHGPDLLMALSTATVRFPDIEWIKALGEHWIARHGQEDTDDAARSLATLLKIAPAQDRETLLLWLLRALGSAPFALAYTLLACVDTRWNAEITNRALQLVANASRSDTQQWSHTRTALAEWGRRVDVTAAAAKLTEILERCPPESPWRNALEHLNALVDFRLAMYKELLT